MDDHELSELVREWLRENGMGIAGGLAIGLAGVAGWQWWQHSGEQHRLDASTTYQALEEALVRNDPADANQLAEQLGSRFGDTTYSTMGKLLIAEQRITQGDLDGAMEVLEDAQTSARVKALDGLIRVRLARVQLAAGEPQQALDTIAGVVPGDYAGLVAEIRGDAYLAQGQAELATQAYQDALAALETGAPNRSILEMKLANLGVSTTSSDA